MSKDGKSFFSTLPGILTGLASLIAAGTGLYIALNNNATSPRPIPTPVPVSQVETAEQHRQKMEALKRQQEIEKLKLQQERERIEAQKELERLKIEANEISRKRQEQQPRTENISGNWTLTNLFGTYTFVMRQNGNNITLTEYDPQGAVVGEGNGTIENKNVNLTLTETMLFDQIQVNLSLVLSHDGRSLNGQMFTQGTTMAATLFRQ